MRDKCQWKKTGCNKSFNDEIYEEEYSTECNESFYIPTKDGDLFNLWYSFCPACGDEIEEEEI